MIRALLVLVTLFPVVAIPAQQSTPGEPASITQEADSGRQRHAKVYLGFTSNGSTDFTLGVEFIRRQGRSLGLAGFAEFVFASDTEFLIGGTLQYYTRRRLYLELGPGFAFNGGSDFFWRLGAGYELELAKFTLVPKAYLDFVHGETRLGYGVGLGRRF